MKLTRLLPRFFCRPVDIPRCGQAEREGVAGESPNRLLFFEQTALAVIQWDDLFRVTGWNRAAERMFGYRAQEALGQFVTFLVPPAAQEDLKQLVMNLAEHQDVLSSATKIRTKDGRIIVCRWDHTPLTSEEGKFLGTLSLCEEITEHIRAEEELERLAAVVRHCRELVMLTSREGKITFLNEAGYKMLGIEPHRAHHHFFTDVLADHLRQKLATEIWPALLEGETWKGELRYRNLKTQELFEVQATAFSIRDSRVQQPLYLANISLDITESKRTQASLREKDRKLQLFMENTCDFIWMINFSGKATYVSPSMKRLLGYDPEEFRRFTFKDYLAPASAELAFQRLEKAIADIRPGEHLEPVTFELEYRRKDGTFLWAEVHANGTYDEKGDVIGVQGITSDITERKRGEEVLRQSEERYRELFENVATK